MRSLIATRHSGYPPRVNLLFARLLLRAHRAARADDLPSLDRTDSLPGLTTQLVPASENHCTAGRSRRVDAVVREWRRDFDPLAASCDHDSIFALAYLRITEQYRRTIEDPTFFEDTALVNHEDAIFASYSSSGPARPQTSPERNGRRRRSCIGGKAAATRRYRVRCD